MGQMKQAMIDEAAEYDMSLQEYEDGLHMSELHGALSTLRGCISDALWRQVEKELGFEPIPAPRRPWLDDGEPASF